MAMEVLSFLKQRTEFIRQFYTTSAAPFVERKRKIEAEEAPFEPEYREYDYPPFLSEWLEAEESTHVLGQTCICLLSTSLQLFFKAWEDNLNIRCADYVIFNKKTGWLHPYLTCFTGLANLTIEDCPADICLIEEVVLIRNSVQHESDLWSVRIGHSNYNLSKLQRVFFAAEHEREAINEFKELGGAAFYAPRLDLTAERIDAAIAEVDRLCVWLDEKLWRVLYL